MARDWSIEAIAERMKDEIGADVRAGIVPAGVRSFSALHDHVDANGYGGFFDEDAADAGSLARRHELASAAAERIEPWLAAGGAAGTGE